METKLTNDGTLPLNEYWMKFKERIADVHDFGKRVRRANVTHAEGRANTLGDYDRAVSAIGQFLPEKPMAEVTVFELLQAVQKSRHANGRDYTDSTVYHRISALHAIYGFAQARGDACNNLEYLNYQQLNKYVKAVGLPLSTRQKIMKPLLAESRNKKRSLTAHQQEKLVNIILEHIEEDGRYLMLAILLYTGMRPSECRGLNWRDLVPFQDHPERHMLPIRRQRDAKGSALRNSLKRPASYRKIGVHIELEEIIARRLAFTLKHFSSFDEIASLPMCCFKNEFERGCSRSQLSTFAVKTLKESLHVSNEVLDCCVLDMYVEEGELLPEGEDEAEDLDVYTYLLRHDEWTWMQATTELSANGKRYLFGHAIYDGKVDLHPDYNDEDQLWELLLKLDHTVKYLPLHADALRGTIGPDSALSVPNVGRYSLRLSPELLRKGGHVIINVQANEYNDPIHMETLSPTKTLFSADQPLIISAEQLPCTREETYRRHINTDYGNLKRRRSNFNKKKES